MEILKNEDNENPKNTYEITVRFYSNPDLYEDIDEGDGEEFLGFEQFTVQANSVEEAYDLIDSEIIENGECYPSDNYEMAMVDTY